MTSFPYPELLRSIETINKLRDPVDGCPWDLAQNHQTLLQYLIEESYEFLDAVEREDEADMVGELGDVLLQVLLHARIAEQNGSFNLEQVAKFLSDKLIFRHPHVFKDRNLASTPDEVLKNWGELKKQEKKVNVDADAGANTSTNPDEDRVREDEIIPATYLKFPALFSAYKIGKKTHDIAFDWDTPQEVWEKVQEEWAELEVEWKKLEALKQEQRDQEKRSEEINQTRELVKEELGDLMFTLAQLARHLKMNPEEILRDANRKFCNRFQMMQELMMKEGAGAIKSLTLEEKEKYWSRIKNL